MGAIPRLQVLCNDSGRCGSVQVGSLERLHHELFVQDKRGAPLLSISLRKLFVGEQPDSLTEAEHREFKTFQLWYHHNTPPAQFGQIPPETENGFLYLRRLYIKWQNDELDKHRQSAGTGSGKSAQNSGKSSNIPAGFGPPGSENQGNKRGIGHVKGPGIPIGRKTNVGNIRKARFR